MRNELLKCRKCGREIGIITWGVYRKAIVDPKALMVVTDPDGEDFVRIDGSKVRGRISPYDSEDQTEYAYRLHRKTCGVDE